MSLEEKWLSIDFSLLQEWVDTREPEDLHLDFKLVLRAPDLTTDDKKNFAKAVSGFANSDGGIIVWGIDARKENGVDAASELKPLKQPDAVMTRLASLTGQAATPIVEGMQHRLITVTPREGFIATLVPASDLGPHMAGLGEGRYYKRSGDSFYRMEHFDVADMFGRRSVPRLQLDVVKDIGGIVNEVLSSFEPIIMLRNLGRGAARFPYLRFRPSSPYGINSFELRSNVSGLPRRPQAGAQDWGLYAGGVNDVIHPGTVLQVTRLKPNDTFHVVKTGKLPDLRARERTSRSTFRSGMTIWDRQDRADMIYVRRWTASDWSARSGAC